MNQMKRLALLAGIVVLLLVTAFATAAFAQTPDPQNAAPAACPMADDDAACPMTGNGQAACPMARGAAACPAMQGNGVCPAQAGQDGAAACPMAGGMQGMMSGPMHGMMRGGMSGPMWDMMRDMMGRFGMMGRPDMMRGWNAPQGEQGPARQMPNGCPMHQSSGTTL